MVESTLAVGKKSIRFWTFNGKSLMNRNVLSVTIAGQSKEENSRRAELDTIKIYHLKKEYGAVKTLLMDLLITKCIWCVYNGYRVRHTLFLLKFLPAHFSVSYIPERSVFLWIPLIIISLSPIYVPSALPCQFPLKFYSILSTMV